MAKFGDPGDVVKCSFCGKSQKHVSKLIAGTGVYICTECVSLCNDIIEGEVGDGPSGAETPVSPPSEDKRRWVEAHRALVERRGRRPTVSELAAELGWTPERVAAISRAARAASGGGGFAGTRPPGMIGELRGVQHQLDHLAERVAGLVERAGMEERVETMIASETSVGEMNSGPRWPNRVFPDVESVAEVEAEDQVQLHYDEREGRLIGTLGHEPVEWHLVRYDHHVSGRIGAVGLQASWTSGDNYVPEPGGWTPRADYVSDFPNIPADLTGSFGDLDAELHGVFHLDPDYAFQRGSILGRIGAVHMEATVLAASGGLRGRTVAVEGTYGSSSFEIYATIDGGQGIVHGSVDEATVHLDLVRPSVPRSVRPGYPPIDFPGPEVFLLGGYHGPPELLAVMVGAILRFM